MTIAYDPLGRIARYTAGGTATDFLYDGDALAVEYDASGNVLRRYVHGQGTDVPLVQYEGATLAVERYLHADERGSIVAIADAAGNAITLNRYDEYGVPAATNSGRFQYTGQLWLPEAGLYHYKARAYAPALGRFLQTDPVGYEDQFNLYAYVRNDPMNGSDPTGRQCLCQIFRRPQEVPYPRRDPRDIPVGPFSSIRLPTPNLIPIQGGPFTVAIPGPLLNEGPTRADAENRITGGAPADRRTKGGTRIYNDPPTGESAEEIFADIADMEGVEVTRTEGSMGEVRVATLPDGSRVIDRNSRTGPRTIETQTSGGRTKTETRFPRDPNLAQ